MPEPIPALGFVELVESSLAGLARGGSAFRAAAARPAPSFGAAAALAAASGAAALGINLVRSAVSAPDFLARFPPVFAAAVGLAALGLCASVWLLLAVLLYGLGNALGGRGGFERGLQAAAALSLLAPLQALCSAFPLAWAAPALLGAWGAAGALEGLFGARAAAARVLCALGAAAALGLQYGTRVLVGRAREAYELQQAAASAAASSAELDRQLRQFQQAAAATSAPPTAGLPGAPAPASGLDLLRGPDDSGAPAAPASAPSSPEAASEAARSLNAHAVGMLDALQPILSNPALAKSASPQMQADVKELQSIIAEVRAQAVSGKPLSDAEFAKRQARLQQLMMKLMAASLQAPPAGQTPHLKPAGGR